MQLSVVWAIRHARLCRSRHSLRQVSTSDRRNATARRLGRGVITVVPVTSNTDRLFPFQVLLTRSETGLPRDSKAQAEQVRSIAIERVGGRLGVVPEARMREIDEALRLHLAL